MKIKRLSLEIFGGCNFVCQMCPQGEEGREQEFLRVMPFELFKDIVLDAKQYGVQVVNIEGSGEEVKYRYKSIDIENGNIFVWDAELHHFSRYGWTRKKESFEDNSELFDKLNYTK